MSPGLGGLGWDSHVKSKVSSRSEPLQSTRAHACGPHYLEDLTKQFLELTTATVLEILKPGKKQGRTICKYNPKLLKCAIIGYSNHRTQIHLMLQGLRGKHKRMWASVQWYSVC